MKGKCLEPCVQLGELSFHEIMEVIANGKHKNFSFDVKREDRQTWNAYVNHPE